MAISVKNHDDRITSLEKKLNQIGTGEAVLVESKLAADGYAKFSNSLLINWGTTVSNPHKFVKPYSKAVWSVICTPTAGGSQRQESDGVVAISLTDFRSEILGGRGYTQGRFVAFGI